MKRSATPVDEHIASLEGEVGRQIAVLDEMITAVFAGEPRLLWEGRFWGGTEQAIIGYGDHRYETPKGGTTEWFKVGLAAQKNHISLYVNAVEDGDYIPHLYGDRLGKVKLGAASVGFRHLDEVDVTVLQEMIDHARRVLAGP